jgi:DNA-binding IclR family transcriptional regulator
MSTIGLSAPAAYVLRSLMEHPQRDTAQAIADGAPDAEGLDTATTHDGLDELAARGLAVEGEDGRWRLTDRGRAAQQPG